MCIIYEKNVKLYNLVSVKLFFGKNHSYVVHSLIGEQNYSGKIQNFEKCCIFIGVSFMKAT